MAFLRNSTPDNWGVKKEKEKRKMEEIQKAEAEENVEEKGPEVQYRRCTRCGERKELNEDSFGHHAKTKDGWANICLECRSIAMRKKNEKTSQATRRGIIKNLKDGDNPVVELDFNGNEEAYEKICNIAGQCLRTPENQILWWLINTDFSKMGKGLAGE